MTKRYRAGGTLPPALLAYNDSGAAELVVKDVVAELSPTADDGSEHGTFEVILSTPAQDRDGESVKANEWHQPLPDHVTFDIDHGMSVASTVGSGRPTLDGQGRLIVAGTYASTELGQTTRALVNEGHIRTTSVAFLRRHDRKSGRVVRELLNGAFVAVPCNPAALVLASKAFKEGRRHNATDKGRIQTIHDHATELGADCAGPATKALEIPADWRESLAEIGGLVPDTVRARLADTDPTTLPDGVRDVFAALGLLEEDPGDTQPSAVTDSAEESAAAAADEAAAAEESAEKAAADRAAALSVRASHLRALSTLASIP